MVLSPEGWATGPCRPLGGRQVPFFFSRDFVANLKKKNYTLGMSPYGRATGVYFWNFSKRTYIFEILFFLNIKKKKLQCFSSYIDDAWWWATAQHALYYTAVSAQQGWMKKENKKVVIRSNHLDTMVRWRIAPCAPPRLHPSSSVNTRFSSLAFDTQISRMRSWSWQDAKAALALGRGSTGGFEEQQQKGEEREREVNSRAW